MLIIGFGNKARNGKDTAADAITDFYDRRNISRLKHLPSYKGIVRVGTFKYATALYRESSGWLGTAQGLNWLKGEPGADTSVYWSDGEDHLGKPFELPSWVTPEPNPEVNELAPFGKHPKLLQWWGTEFRRNNFGEDYWVKKTFASIPANLDIALITDVRFPNEAEAIESKGGYTVNVKRLRDDGTQYHDPSRPIDHISETALDNWNWNFRLVIPNGHVALLEQQAVTLAEYLKGLHR